jgi:hypothetical protein
MTVIQSVHSYCVIRNVIGRPGGCEGCVMGWVKFSPYADSGDIRRLTNFDLSCLTRWRACMTQEDIMPDAWKQYPAEDAPIGESLSPVDCPSFVAQMIGRDSANIATGQVLNYGMTAASSGSKRLSVKIRVLGRLKGVSNPGESVASVPFPLQIQKAQRPKSKGDRKYFSLLESVPSLKGS